MKILYINPALRPEARVRYFPLGAGFVITALTRAGFNVTLADMDIRGIDVARVAEIAACTSYNVVMIGSIVTGYRIVKELAACIRQILPDAIIIAGNSVASSIPRQLLTFTEVDIAVLGEGDITAVELIQAISEGRHVSEVPGITCMVSGELYTSPRRSPIKDISSIPMINYDLFDTAAYIETSRHAVLEPFPMPIENIRPFTINTVRGCIADCTFCYHVFKGEIYRTRTEADIMAEIEYLSGKYGVNYVFFHDDLSIFSKQKARQLADAIIGSGLHFNWWGTCRAGLFDSENDLHLLEALKRSGCVGLGYSLENAAPDILKAMNKHITPDDFVRQAHLLERAGLSNYTSLVFGYPQETESTIAKTFDTCIQARVCPSVGFLLPLPSSKMYDYCLTHGYIVDEDQYLMGLGDRQNLQINLTKMTDIDFNDCVHHHLARLYKTLGIQSESDDLVNNERYKSVLPGTDFSPTHHSTPNELSLKEQLTGP